MEIVIPAQAPNPFLRTLYFALRTFHLVIPAQAGIQKRTRNKNPPQYASRITLYQVMPTGAQRSGGIWATTRI